ncbi:hypothetical protein AALB39_21335 [Lachnospiraceae bacterium 54-53]
MRKLPVFVLAAATALTVAGVPMTAQAATCPTSGFSSYLTNCSGQTGNINSILNQLGCSNGTKGATTGSGNCYSGSTKGASCSGNKSSNSCSNSNSKNTNSNSCKTSSRCWR